MPFEQLKKLSQIVQQHPKTAAFSALAIYYLFRVVHKPSVLCGTTTHQHLNESEEEDSQRQVQKQRLEWLLHRCPTLSSYYFPTFPFWNAWLQVALFVIKSTLFQVTVKYEREEVTFDDGGVIALDWLNPDESTPKTPIVVICHGITGHSQNVNEQDLARETVRMGYRAAVYVRRGHGGMRLRTPQFSVFGDPYELAHVFDLLAERYPGAPVVAAGFSAGSAVVARFAGEQGRRKLAGEDYCRNIVACICVSPGYHLLKACQRIPSPINEFLTSSLRNIYFDKNKDMWSSSTHLDSFEACSSSMNLTDLFASSAVFSGRNTETLDELLEEFNPMLMETFRKARYPLVLVYSADDPICPKKSLDEYWEDIVGHEGNAFVVLTEYGSHVCWLDWLCQNWSSRAIGEMIHAFVTASEEERVDLLNLDFR